MMALIGNSGILLLVFHFLVWLPTPINPLHATSLGLSNGNGAKQESAENGKTHSLNGFERVTHRIRRGDTLGKLLRPYGLSGKEQENWVRSIRKQYSPRRLRPGQEIYFYFSTNGHANNGHTQPGENGNGQSNGKRHLRALALELDEDWVLNWELQDQGIVFRKVQRPYEVEVKAAAGSITDTLYESGERLGLHPEVLSQFVDIFGWEVNFQTDLREGDSFRVLYERKYRTEGKKKESFRVLAAELTAGGEKHFGIYFEKEDGDGGYFDRQGKSLARTFLRYPVQFSRISSTFSHRRFHPILKVRRAHRGIDFVAKRGTPVRAVGDGRVTYAGWKRGGYGRFIEIQHGSAFRTRYAHLNGYARGIRRGSKVKKGQIIGYVGCSGRCTGTHLHFEMYKNQRYVNPLKIRLPREEKIEPALREVFENAKQLILTQLNPSSRSGSLNGSQPSNWH
jgi:murein DD-endopeptidase MepM/ murein hydrolase activator NlpD